MNSIEEKVVTILKKYTFNPSVWNNYNPDLKIINDLKINSARIIDVTLDVEEEFNLEISDEQLEKIITVKDLISAIEQKLNA